MSLLLALFVASPSPVLSPGDYFRSLSFADCGDVNSDGVADIAIGLPRDDAHGVDAGRVFIISGKDGAILRELHNGLARSGFGAALATGVNLVGNGERNLVVTTHLEDHDCSDALEVQGRPGRAYVYALATGELLRELGPPADTSLGSGFGDEARVVGDIDGDGTPDLLVASSDDDLCVGGLRSPMCIFSGKSGQLLRMIAFKPESVPFLLGDLDGDDKDDAARRDGDGFAFFSLATGRRLACPPLTVGAFKPRELVDVGDLDGDRCSDVAAIGMRDDLRRCEDVLVLSMRERKQIFNVSGVALRHAANVDAQSWASRIEVCGAPDVDGDGRGELFIALPGANRSLTGDEWKRIHPGEKMPVDTALSGFGALVSSRTGAFLWTAFGTNREPLGSEWFDYGGAQVLRVGDFDGDGADDIAVSTCLVSRSTPYEEIGANLTVLSSKTGARVLLIEARPGLDPRVTVSARRSEPAQSK